jgi:adenylate cyclase
MQAKHSPPPRFWQRFLSPPFLITLAVTLFVGGLVLYRPQATENVERGLYNLKFRLRGEQPATPEVVVVAIDEASLEQLGRWPWSREVIARFFARLKEAGPRVIGLDIIFAEREETAGLAVIRRLRQTLEAEGRVPPEVAALLAREEERADVDRRLAQVIGQGVPTVLGFYFKEVGGLAVAPRIGEALGPKAIKASTYNLVRWLDRPTTRLPLFGAREVEVNLPLLTDAAAGGGYFNMVPDPDGTVRWIPLAIAYGQGPDFFAPMTLVTLQHAMPGTLNTMITLSQLGVEQVRLGPVEIPVDRFGRLFINYRGGLERFTTVSALAVMEGRLPPGAIKDKIVLVGATAPGIYDLRVTPFSENLPGIAIQATVVDNILRGDFIRLPRYPFLTTIGFIVAMALILGVILPQLSALKALLFAVAIQGAYLLGNYLAFAWGGVHLEVLYPFFQVAGVYTGITLHRFLAEERERLRIRKAFESYVAPAVVQQIIRHPELLRLYGERRQLSILFSDIRGFTDLSETLEPEALREVLHDFLDPMSEIIVNQGGTIDKYMGDAIMALFGAPLDLPDHAGQACRAALLMSRALKELDRRWVEEGRPSLRMGVGINSGLVAVGNMGSSRLFDYTAVGDNVNLASRLEGLNKYYGTEILISAATAELTAGAFILREVDLVRVKGKKRPIAIFELLGEGAPEEELAAFLTLYNEALQRFRQRDWTGAREQFEAARARRPHDHLCCHYLNLSRKFLASPPPPEWEGITTMVEK